MVNESDIITVIKYSQVGLTGSATALPPTPLANRKRMTVQLGLLAMSPIYFCNADGSEGEEFWGDVVYEVSDNELRTFYFDPDVAVAIYAKGSGSVYIEEIA